MVASAQAVADRAGGSLTPTAGLVLLTVVFARMLSGIPAQAGKKQSVDPHHTAAHYLAAGGQHLRERVIRRVEADIPRSAMKPIAADTSELDRKRRWHRSRSSCRSTKSEIVEGRSRICGSQVRRKGLAARAQK
jgi:hypothetical protein